MMDFGSWETWIQDVGKSYIQTRTEAQYKAPIELQKMQLQAYGPFGQPYLEGVPNGAVPNIGGIPTWMVLGGVALVVVLALN
jgi:hypothetical protein